MEQSHGGQIGRYQILEEIGQGAVGIVYKGYDPNLDLVVAIKILQPHLAGDAGAVESFLRQARAAARLKHSHIVTIYDVGQTDEGCYMVMEYLEGPSLMDFIWLRGAMPPEEVWPILRPMAEALDYAHQEGVIHGDLRPGNAIVSPRGRVTLTDFGLAVALSLVPTVVSEYKAIEQLVGEEIGPWTDLYALGVVAYEMLAGQPPFAADSAPELLQQTIYQPPLSIRIFRPDLPATVEEVLARNLSKTPRTRYATATQFVNTLEKALSRQGPELAPPTPLPAAQPVPPVPPTEVLAAEPAPPQEVQPASPVPPPAVQPTPAALSVQMPAVQRAAPAPDAPPTRSILTPQLRPAWATLSPDGQSAQAASPAPKARPIRNASLPSKAQPVQASVAPADQPTHQTLPSWLWAVLAGEVLLLILGLALGAWLLLGRPLP